jgi:hypothetical protein
LFLHFAKNLRSSSRKIDSKRSGTGEPAGTHPSEREGQG